MLTFHQGCLILTQAGLLFILHTKYYQYSWCYIFLITTLNYTVTLKICWEISITGTIWFTSLWPLTFYESELHFFVFHVEYYPPSHSYNIAPLLTITLFYNLKTTAGKPPLCIPPDSHLCVFCCMSPTRFILCNIISYIFRCRSPKL